MAQYFHGRREIGKFIQEVEDGRGRIHCVILEEWNDSDNSTTAWCGIDGTCTVEKTVGLSEKENSTLKGVIEATIGIKDVVGIKSQIEESIGREVNWTESKTTSRTFAIKAPKCGRCTLTVYNLIRIYNLTYYRKSKNPFRRDKWVWVWNRTLRERTDNHDLVPDFVPYHERCKCTDPKESPPSDGRLGFDFGGISFRVPYLLTDKGFDVQIMEKTVSLTFTDRQAMLRGLDHGFDVTLPVVYIPEPLLFLGDVTGDALEGTIKKDAEPILELSATVVTQVSSKIGSLTVGMKDMTSIAELEL
jgi:hypothetical protein